jgi:2-polyprenyl-3-methyl-5-hydroxy-6-metoxy-1,4-benzoquinol methylase
MATLTENENYWTQYDWSQRGDEWSATWGGAPYLWWGTLYPRILRSLPTATMLEIAPGFGRITQFLKNFCDRLIVVDLTERCIEACQERFKDASNITYHTNDGKSLEMIEDGSIDFAFSFDSLVHVEAEEMKSYITELSRKLAPEGVGFFHHSNIGAFTDPETGELAIENPHWRAPSMSAQILREHAARQGIACVRQELINWGGEHLNDCFSFFTRAGSSHDRPFELRENPGFMDEANALGALARHYAMAPESAP